MTELPLSQADLCRAVQYWLNIEMLKKPHFVTAIKMTSLPGEDLQVTVTLEEKPDAPA